MIYRFETFELDLGRRELRDGPRQCDIEPQVFDLLALLIDRRDRVVGKDELFDTIWQGRIVSDSTLSSRIAAARRALGDDGDRQRLIRTVPRRGFRFVGTINDDAPPAGTVPPDPAAPDASPAQRQTVRICTSADGTQIAYATTGSGAPLVRAGTWLTHLEHDWHSPIWRPFLDALGQSFAFTRYDQRGNGLSDRSMERLDQLNLATYVADMEAVIDAAGLDRFPIYGISQGAPIAIEYAARHPDRITHLVLHGGFVQGRALRSTAAEREEGEALVTLMRHGWGKESSAFPKAFASLFIPDASKEQLDSFAELQTVSTSGEIAALLRQAADHFDVTDRLADIDVPTLVIHARNDDIHPLDQGRKLAAGIAGAEFLMLESNNHILLAGEPAFDELLAALRDFLLGPAGS